jgi:hypothetical protein
MFHPFNLLKSLLFLLLALSLSGCPYWPDDYEFEYETIVTDSPTNLEGINSQYDDYNSALPYPAAVYGLYFSTNRYHVGLDFDIIYRDLDISYHEKDDVLDVHYYFSNENNSHEQTLLTQINSSSNQLGPQAFFGPGEHSYFFYGDDQNGDFDIRFTHHMKSEFSSYGSEGLIHGPDSLQVINSDKDDLYPSINEDLSRLFFCSNRDYEHFNIYSIPLPGADNMHEFLTGNEVQEANLEAVLSSDSDDKCPFIYKDIMVFASDRKGGQGGFDLYYSHNINGTWTDPVNFGPEINTEYDEYRPIVFSFVPITTLMIFSSDRPGGMGGFDLYMVRADGHIQGPGR